MISYCSRIITSVHSQVAFIIRYTFMLTSCAETLHTTCDDDANLHSCADTLNESDDERDFGDSPTPPISSGDI